MKTILSVEEVREFELLKLYYEAQWQLWHEATSDEEMTKAIYEVRNTNARLDEIRLKVIDSTPLSENEKILLKGTLRNVVQRDKLDKIIIEGVRK